MQSCMQAQDRSGVGGHGSGGQVGDEEANASKKPRVTWSVEMHQKFVAAVNMLGVESERVGA